MSGTLRSLGKSEEAVRLALAKVHKEAACKERAVQSATQQLAKYVILFITVPERDWSAAEVPAQFRTRSQVGPIFKWFKSLAGRGCPPKCNDESAKAWVCGKPFASLPIEKLIRYASAVSPRGYGLEPGTPAQRVA